MKLIALLLLCPFVVMASEMVVISDHNIRPVGETSLSEALLRFAKPFRQNVWFKKGDVWRDSWRRQTDAAVRHLAESKSDQESLRLSLARFLDANSKNVTALERVVRARLNGEPVWVVVAGWEDEGFVRDIVADKGEVELIHIRIMAYRMSDQEIVGFYQCD